VVEVGLSLRTGLAEVLAIALLGIVLFVEAFVDGDAMIDEPSPNRALPFISSAVEGFTILDERAELAMAFGRHY